MPSSLSAKQRSYLRRSRPSHPPTVTHEVGGATRTLESEGRPIGERASSLAGWVHGEKPASVLEFSTRPDHPRHRRTSAVVHECELHQAVNLAASQHLHQFGLGAR